MICSWRGTVALNCVALVLLLLHSTETALARVEAERYHRVLGRTANGKPSFLRGNLGTVQVSSHQGIAGGDDWDEHELSTAAAAKLRTILRDHIGSSGREGLQVVRMRRDVRGDTHIRFKGLIDGVPVEAASMVMHIDASGTVYALNGELVSAIGVTSQVRLTCDEAFDTALTSSWEFKKVTGTWRSECELTFVQAMNGAIHKAWTRTLEYEKTEHGSTVYRLDKLFASVETGEMVAILPQIDGVAGVPALITRDLLQAYDESVSTLVSNSSEPINTTDVVANAAHNHARDAYLYYWSAFGRDSFDNSGSSLTSYVHYGSNEVGAFQDGNQALYFGDGDGTNILAFSLGLDVLAHEYTHLVTRHESDLMSMYEPGALNEAMSDIMGATIEHVVKKKSIADTFRMGEDVYVTTRGLRNMANPQTFGDPDFYPTRSIGTYDRGYIHFNNGIMNLAFALMVKGGTHPQRKTSIVVTRLNSNFTKSMELGASIFYHANTDCLTPQSGFREARLCTENHAGSFKSSVSQAWEAVGVSAGMLTVQRLTVGVARAGISAPKNKLRHFQLKNLKPGGTVTCVVSRGSKVELYIGNQGFPDSVNKTSPANSCLSIGSANSKSCTTKYSVSMDLRSVYITLKAVDAYANASITCSQNNPVPIPLRNGSPKYVLEAGTGDLLYYASLGKVRSGETIHARLRGNNGDADLYVGYGTLPDSNNGDTFECNSADSGSNEACDGVAPSNFTLYALALMYDSLYDLTVLLRYHPTSIALSDGVAVDSQSSAVVDSIQDYMLDGLVSGHKVMCELGGATLGAELYVRFDDLPETSISSSVNSCSSSGTVPTKACTTRAVTDQTEVYATVYTRQPYANVSVKCSLVDGSAPTSAPETRPPTAAPTTPCKSLNVKCQTVGQCCKGTRIICEGATPTTRTCQRCRTLTAPCIRNSQCCSKHCRSGKCRAT